jgi:hypothetical protein
MENKRNMVLKKKKVKRKKKYRSISNEGRNK